MILPTLRPPKILMRIGPQKSADHDGQLMIAAQMVTRSS
jgi:hypothetical protein